MAASLYETVSPSSKYVDRQQSISNEEYQENLRQSSTLYIGNLSTYTQEEQIHEYFSYCGEVRRVIMGLDRYKRTPCGFCFVEFERNADAGVAVSCLNRSKLDGRVIRVDWDIGFKEGRQFGRGKGGGQKRDSVRYEIDKEEAKAEEGIGSKRYHS